MSYQEMCTYPDLDAYGQPFYSYHCHPAYGPPFYDVIPHPQSAPSCDPRCHVDESFHTQEEADELREHAMEIKRRNAVSNASQQPATVEDLHDFGRTVLTWIVKMVGNGKRAKVLPECHVRIEVCPIVRKVGVDTCQDRIPNCNRFAC